MKNEIKKLYYKLFCFLKNVKGSGNADRKKILTAPNYTIIRPLKSPGFSRSRSGVSLDEAATRKIKNHNKNRNA